MYFHIRGRLYPPPFTTMNANERRPLALGNAADAIEILSAGYILNAFTQEDGSPITNTQKGRVCGLRFSSCELEPKMAPFTITDHRTIERFNKLIYFLMAGNHC